MKNVLTVITVGLFSLFVFYQLGQSETGATVDYVPERIVRSMEGKATSGIDLYVKPDEEAETNKPKIDRRKADPKAYKAVYSEAREKGVIVVFGASWCGWCRLQVSKIPDGYRVLYVEVDEKKHGKEWRALMTKWEVVETVLGKEAPTYPTTVVAVDGIPIDYWYGFKPWRTIEKRVQKAKKDETKRLNSGGGGRPWIEPRTFRGRQRPKYQPRYGRWSKR